MGDRDRAPIFILPRIVVCRFLFYRTRNTLYRPYIAENKTVDKTKEDRSFRNNRDESWRLKLLVSMTVVVVDGRESVSEILIRDSWLYFRFSTKESATHAIVAVHNTDINGQTVKCSWGKESGDPNNAQQTGQVNVRSFIEPSRRGRNWGLEVGSEYDLKIESPFRSLDSIRKNPLKISRTELIGDLKRFSNECTNLGRNYLFGEIHARTMF